MIPSLIPSCNQQRWRSAFAGAIVTLLALLSGAGFASTPSLAGQALAAHTEGKSGAEFKKAEDILIFINGYRDNKEVERIPGMVRALLRLGMLKDPEKSGVYIGFLAGVLSDNQLSASQLAARMFPLPPSAQVVLIKAIAYSDLPDWKHILATMAERMPARKVLIKRYLYQNGKTLRELPMSTGPEIIDTHWGYYFATGRYDAVLPILSVLGWTQDQDDVEKLTIGSMAKWTLASNASRDKNLLDLCKSEMNHQPAHIRLQLREIVQAAETFELAAIRKNAVTAIEKLKIKGPQSALSAAWWGEAGTTVLALGCVVASALGQVQLGIPCVVGGALSQAAVNYIKKPPPF